jgi:serine/threonine protein kinase
MSCPLHLMFNPTLETRLTIDGQEFKFSPHPVVPSLVWGQEGRHAIVYRLQQNNDQYALKVFRPVFRHPGLLESANALWTYHELPGMRVCRQTVITKETHPDLVAKHEDLHYSMLMPWITGKTWFDYLQTRERLTLDQARAVAESMAWTLYALEINYLAHCDLSSGNVIIDPKLDMIHLVDVEDLYSPWLTPPPMVPAGTPGYQHQESGKGGQWGPLGDRFAGALLLAEMLGWSHPNVRKAAYGESFFAPNEIQKESERYDILRSALQIYDPGFAEAFEATWWAQSLDECPPLKTWYDLLDSLPRDPVDKWAPIDKKLYEEIVPTPPEIAVGKPLPKVDTTAGGASQPVTPSTRRGCLPTGCLKGCQAIAALFGVILLICVIGSGIMWFSTNANRDESVEPTATPTEQETSFTSNFWIMS